MDVIWLRMQSGITRTCLSRAVHAQLDRTSPTVSIFRWGHHLFGQNATLPVALVAPSDQIDDPWAKYTFLQALI